MIGRFPFFVNLAAADLERAKRWYADKLDLSPAMDLGVGGLLYVSGRHALHHLSDRSRRNGAQYRCGLGRR